MSTTPPQGRKSAKRPDDARGTPPGAGTVITARGGRIGNPPYQATEAQRQKVRTLAKTFPIHAEKLIARLIGCSVDTLRRHFEDDLELGRAEMLASVGAQMITRAIQGDDAVDANGKLLTPGNLDAQKYILARLGGWTTKVEHSGPGGGPVEIIDLSNLSEEELEDYGRLSARAQGLEPDEVDGPDNA